MIDKTETEQWDNDSRLADNVHPNSFANGPIVRSFKRFSQHVSIVGENLLYIGTAGLQVKDAIGKLSDEIRKSNSESKKIQEVGTWLTVIIAATGIIELVKIFDPSEQVIVLAFVGLSVILGLIVGKFILK